MEDLELLKWDRAGANKKVMQQVIYCILLLSLYQHNCITLLSVSLNLWGVHESSAGTFLHFVIFQCRTLKVCFTYTLHFFLKFCLCCLWNQCVCFVHVKEMVRMGGLRQTNKQSRTWALWVSMSFNPKKRLFFLGAAGEEELLSGPVMCPTETHRMCLALHW